METKYYDTETTLDRYADSPQATAFLLDKIERSCPDAFHWHDVETARELAAQDEIANAVDARVLGQNNTLVALYMDARGTTYAYKMHIIHPTSTNEWQARERLSGKNVCTRGSLAECIGFIEYQLRARLSEYYKTGI